MKRLHSTWWMVLATLAGVLLASPGETTVIGIPEVGDLRGSATSIDAYFDLSLDPDIFESTATPHATVESGIENATDVDWYSFLGSAGSRAFFDIDEDPFVVDTTMGLFNSSGTLLALVDDSFPTDPGSASILDSFLGVFTLPQDGTYYLGVSSWARFPSVFCTSSTSLARPDGMFGGVARNGCTPGNDSWNGTGTLIGQPGPYTLHVSVEGAGVVPEPTTLFLLGSGLAGFALRRRVRG